MCAAGAYKMIQFVESAHVPLLLLTNSQRSPSLKPLWHGVWQTVCSLFLRTGGLAQRLHALLSLTVLRCSAEMYSEHGTEVVGSVCDEAARRLSS